ncbi:MAG: dihydrodipicolinate synthase family protein [Deltaproteobacteria bacterium]|nr:dihydrodipicolinate synthase family protein [Deltaproteobacteria bacterium]
MKKFAGIYTVMVTAYDEAGAIDRHAMAALTKYLAGSGVHGLVVLGSGGECPYLSHDLQKAAIDVVIETCAGSIPVIVGINERGTGEAITMARYAQQAGADGLLIALPVFYPLSEEDVYHHYNTLCSQINLPVLYYNFPSHSHLILTPQQIAGLTQIVNIVGAKETIFKSAEVRELVEATNDDFSVFTGTCLNLTKMMGVGACGAICPLPNVAPQTAVDLYEALKKGETEKAANLQEKINKIMYLLGGAPSPHALMKEALRLLGHPVRIDVKSPLPQLTSGQAVMVKKTLSDAGLL